MWRRKEIHREEEKENKKKNERERKKEDEGKERRKKERTEGRKKKKRQLFETGIKTEVGFHDFFISRPDLSPFKQAFSGSALSKMGTVPFFARLLTIIELTK